MRNRPEALQQLNKQVQQKYPPTSKDLARDHSMHRTSTCDFCTVVYGEIHLMTDTGETVLKPGDTAIVQGVNHAWSNKSDKPCMIIGVEVRANPWPTNQNPQKVSKSGGLLHVGSPRGAGRQACAAGTRGSAIGRLQEGRRGSQCVD